MEKNQLTLTTIRYELERELKMRQKVYPQQWKCDPVKRRPLQLQQKKMEFTLSIFQVMTPQEFSIFAKRIEARKKTMAPQGSLFPGSQ